MSDTKFWAGECSCTVCGKEWVGVVPVAKGEDVPVIPLECPDCGKLGGLAD